MNSTLESKLLLARDSCLHVDMFKPWQASRVQKRHLDIVAII